MINYGRVKGSNLPPPAEVIERNARTPHKFTSKADKSPGGSERGRHQVRDICYWCNEHRLAKLPDGSGFIHFGAEKE